MGANAISLPRGNTLRLDVVVTDGTGYARDLTNASTATLSVKANPATDAVPLVQKTGTFVDRPNGLVSFFIAPSDTAGFAFGHYAFDVLIVMANGEKYTVLEDDLVITETVST